MCDSKCGEHDDSGGPIDSVVDCVDMFTGFSVVALDSYDDLEVDISRSFWKATPAGAGRSWMTCEFGSAERPDVRTVNKIGRFAEGIGDADMTSTEVSEMSAEAGSEAGTRCRPGDRA